MNEDNNKVPISVSFGHRYISNITKCISLVTSNADKEYHSPLTDSYNVVCNIRLMLKHGIMIHVQDITIQWGNILQFPGISFLFTHVTIYHWFSAVYGKEGNNNFLLSTWMHLEKWRRFPWQQDSHIDSCTQ